MKSQVASNQFQKHDILVAFEQAGGYGDVFFALKVAYLVRQKLKEAKKLTGEVYIIVDKSFGYQDVIDIKGDMEFGVIVIKRDEIKNYLNDGNIVPSYIIECPIFSNLFGIIKLINHPVLIMPEYSIDEEIEGQHHAERGIIKMYEELCGKKNVVYKKTGFPTKQSNSAAKKPKPTTDEDNSEPKGILLSSKLMEKSAKNNISNWFALRLEYRQTLLRDIAADDDFYTPSQYYKHKELSFAYKKHAKGTERFLKAYQAWLSSQVLKSRDVL